MAQEFFGDELSGFESDRSYFTAGTGISRLSLDGIDDSTTVLTNKLSGRYVVIDMVAIGLDFPFTSVIDEGNDTAFGNPTLTVEYVGTTNKLSYRAGISFSPRLRSLDSLENLGDFLVGSFGAFARGFRDPDRWIPFTTSFGVPLRVEYKITPQLRAALGGTLLRSRFVSEDDDDDATWLYGFTPELAYLFPGGVLGVDLSLLWVDSGDDDESIETLGIFARIGESYFVEPRFLLPFDNDIDVWTIVIDLGVAL